MSIFATATHFFLDLGVRATAIFAVTAAVLFALRGASAATRHRIGTFGLAAALVLPLLSLALPRVAVPVLPALASSSGASSRLPWAAILLGLWAAGSLAVGARLVVGWRRVRRLSREAVLVQDREWIADRDAAAASLSLAVPVDVKESEEIPVAITSGWRRPFLLIGRAARLWEADRRRVVLLHELAHVKRGDWLALFVAETAVALYWFHPLAQWLGRRVRRDAEQACDELVIGAGTKPSVYAAHLLGIFRSLGAPSHPVAPALAMGRPHHFEERLRAILDPRAPMGQPATGPARFAMAGLFAAAAAVTMVQPWKPAQCPAAASASHGMAGTPQCASKPAAVPVVARVESAPEEREQAEAAPSPEPPLEPGRSVPALWTPDMESAPDPAVGFVKASNSRRSPRDGSDWYDRGMSLHRRSHYAEAIEAFEKAIGDGYREETASYNIACGYALMGENDKAFEWLHRSMQLGFDLGAYIGHDDDLDGLRSDPRFAELKKAAREQKSSEQKNEARSVASRYERLVARAPKSGEPYFDIGRELLRVDRYDLAAQAFQVSFDRGYRTSTSLYNGACALALDGKKEAALDLLARSLDAGFDQPDLFENDDDLDSLHGDPRFEALARQAQDLSLPGYGNGGGLWSLLSRPNRSKWRTAAHRFEAYAENHPQSGRAWYNVGYASLAGDRPEQGAAAFQKALDLGYRKPTTMYNLACAYARLDQKDVAFDWLFKALDAGFDEQWTMRHDNDLDNLRGDSRYRQAVSIARARDRKDDRD